MVIERCPFSLWFLLIFATLCLRVGTIAESLSLRIGFPFDRYEFTALMGPKVFGLPILLATVKEWVISDVLWASRIVPIFLMIPLSLKVG
jgi:hypothetical protein